MRTNPRTIYLWLLVGAIAGGLASIPIILIYPPTDLAAEHQAAKTPFALAVTSPTMDVIGGVIACMAIAWLLALGAFFLWWRGPRRQIFIEAMLMTSLIRFGMDAFCKLPKLPNGRVFDWTVFVIGVLVGLLGVAWFIASVVAVWRRPNSGCPGAGCVTLPRTA